MKLSLPSRPVKEKGISGVVIVGISVFKHSNYWQILDKQHPADHLVSKQRLGAFIGTSLHDYLRKRGVTQVFLTGIATSSGVESPARSAYDFQQSNVFVE
jgi:nicotinamidase-related amidase